MNCYRDRYRGWRPGTNCVSGGLYVSFKSIEIRCRYFLRSINLIYISFFFFFFIWLLNILEEIRGSIFSSSWYIVCLSRFRLNIDVTVSLCIRS